MLAIAEENILCFSMPYPWNIGLELNAQMQQI